MDFPLGNLLDPQQCYLCLLAVLHPQGLRCPNGHPLGECEVHKKDRAPIIDYRCKTCGRCFNSFTGTILQGTHYNERQIIQMLRGFATGTPTATLAREMKVNRGNLLSWRHRLQSLAEKARPLLTVEDPTLEIDEMYQNAGEKGEPHLDPDDPPRRRANKARGHGTYQTDRPPILGIVGREQGHIHLEVCLDSPRETLEPKVLAATSRGAVINSDEWGAYNHLSDHDRGHVTVCHTPGHREWARDDDGDGIGEVHNNTMEGIWTGLRNFLRPFRGVHKKYLNQYTAIFEWTHNIKSVTLDFLRALLGRPTLNQT